jgi:hypothetical protein
VNTDSATLNGSVNPDGASVSTSFQFGPTTAYGQTTTLRKTGPDDAIDQFSAQLAGLPAGTAIHYRAVVMSDFGTFVGADRTLTTASPPPPPPPPPPGGGRASVGHAHVSGSTASVPTSCTGPSGATCRLDYRLTVTERLKGSRPIAITARTHTRARDEVLVVGTANATVATGASRTVSVALNRAGRKLLAARRHLKATLRALQETSGQALEIVSTQVLTFGAAHRRPSHHR